MPEDKVLIWEGEVGVKNNSFKLTPQEDKFAITPPYKNTSEYYKT